LSSTCWAHVVPKSGREITLLLPPLHHRGILIVLQLSSSTFFVSPRLFHIPSASQIDFYDAAFNAICAYVSSKCQLARIPGEAATSRFIKFHFQLRFKAIHVSEDSVIQQHLRLHHTFSPEARCAMSDGSFSNQSNQTMRKEKKSRNWIFHDSRSSRLISFRGKILMEGFEGMLTLIGYEDRA
jgi:hypothetical protein